MRILHTADWHVGKRLGRIDRTAEYEQALDEVVEIAGDRQVDLVVVAGDLLDRASAPLEAIRLMLDALFRLADGRRVVAIPGNHDSAALFELLAPLVEPRGVHLVPRIRRPEEGGIVTVPSRDGSETAQVACLPFLLEAQVVDFMAGSEEWFKGYMDKIRLLCTALSEAIDPKAAGILAAHFFVEGAVLGGGERRIHVGSQYAATAQAIPAGVHYAALGHVHKPQEIKAAGVPARYAGSLIQLDFSERAHTKEVVIVEASPGRPAKVEPVPLSSGRALLRVEDTLEGLRARAAEFGDAFLDVRVQTSGPYFGLADEVRGFLPNAVLVQAVYERHELPAGVAGRSGRPLSEVYDDYHLHEHGVAAPGELIDAMRSLEEEVGASA